MRPVKACLQCRTGKRRCDREGNSACNQCVQRNLPCSAAVLNREIRPRSFLEPLLSILCHSDEETIHLVDLYFQFMNDKPHSLFHESTFKARVITGTVSPPVLLAMMGLSARFATDPEIRARGPIYAARAKKAFQDDFEHICVENIQACILIGNICYGDSHADAESLYFVLANRMAQILQLSTTVEADDGVTRETKIRIWWSCFIIDTWASVGSNLSRQFKIKVKRPRVPMDENMFYKMKQGDADVSELEWRPGLWGHMVKLVEIYTQIQDFHKHLAETDIWDEDLIEHAVQSLEAELTAFEQSLEPGMGWSLDNLAAYVRRGLGRVFIAFHLGYHHYWTLLFYLYLDHRRPPTRNGRAYADRCKEHATVVCDILKASREQVGAEALYNIVGHVTIVSSSVLLHTYLFGQVDELPDAKQRLESNFESLVQLRSYWSSVEIMINRLVIFQNNCLKSVTRNTYRFDRWMVKFLLQHALALEEKDEELCNSTLDTESDMMAQSVQFERSRVTHGIIMDMQNLDYLR